MKITILTTGSRGDTQPYVALGIELKKAGHEVCLVAFENFEAFIRKQGLQFSPIRGDISQIVASDLAKGATKADNPLKVFTSLNNKKVKGLLLGMQEDLFDACAGSNAIIYHPGAAIGYFVAQHMKIPSIFATPFPMTPTREYPALIFYDKLRLGRRANWVTHKIFEQIMWLVSKSVIKQFWIQQFGKTPEGFSCPFSKQNTRRLPTIVSCSSHVFPRPEDWSEHVSSTGYWFLDDETGFEPSGELLDFLSNGEPPVYVGFGSLSSSPDAAQTTKLVISALKMSGQRGILATGRSMLEPKDVPEDVFIIESAPHSWLFPQMAAVVHHGGASTTAAGFRAGVPSVVIPHANDQFAWGRRVYELGVGAKPVTKKSLTAERLSDAITYALRQEVRESAAHLGKRIRSENGASSAAAFIISRIS